MIAIPKGPPWWRPLARRRWRRALELPSDLPRRLAARIAALTAELGLERAGDSSCTEVVLPGGRLVPRQQVECNAEPTEGAIFAAAEGGIRLIADEHGPGRVWGLPGLELVHLVYDDGLFIGRDKRERPFARLRTVYHHEAESTRPPPVKMCAGPTMGGCPHDASALPDELDGGVRTVYYHCKACLEIYKRRYS